MTELTLAQQLLIIGICSIGTIIPRFLPFLVFRDGDHAPLIVQYLGKALPLGIFALLVVYCLRDVSLSTYPHGIPELLSILVVTTLHFWRHSMILSMAAGTACYMVLVQTVFRL